MLRTKNELESHKKVCKNKDFCGVLMPSEDTKILQFLQYQRSDKTPSIIFTDFGYLKKKKMNGCKNNPEKSSTKVSEHIPSGFSMSTICSFKDIKNKHDVYRGKEYMKKFC